jgi:hypothetical protein
MLRRISPRQRKAPASPIGKPRGDTVCPPLDDISEREVKRRKLGAKKRLDAFRERQREAKRQAKLKERPRVKGEIDTLKCIPVFLWDSEEDEITRLADEVGVDADTGEILIGYEWRRWVGGEAAKIIRNALQARRLRRG